MAAVGNQGRLIASQILSHPVTVPVAAVDATGKLLPDSNFGPLISRKGVATLGNRIQGYAPDGGITTMSGTSVATAVATGIVAHVWSVHPNAVGATIRAAVARLPGRNGLAPPRLVPMALSANVDQILAFEGAARVALQAGSSSSFTSEGGNAMGDGNGPGRVSAQTEAVAPAQAACGCGAPEGSCTCSTGILPARLVYVLGTVDCDFLINRCQTNFRRAAHTLGIEQGEQSVRSWVHQVLIHEPARKGLRYIARNISWLLTVEKQTAYYLALRDWQDLDDLIACLGEPDEHDLSLWLDQAR